MPDGPSKVVQSSRQVIEHRLLTALEEDPSAVAILASKEDLDLLILALADVTAGGGALHGRLGARAKDYLQGLRQLRREAFGK